MNIQDLARKVIDVLERHGTKATLTLVMPGRWGKRDTKRLCPGGPVGRIVSDASGSLLVSFDALDLSAFLTARGFLNLVIVRRDDTPGGTLYFQVKPNQ
jgi:hypothetical protein